jgi:single-stranded-DNA-specific exonuclease
VVGLIAARLKERYERPAFAIALGAGGLGTGSGRSVPGADLGTAVRRAVMEGLLVKGGGHAMAAGVTLRHDRLGEFRAFIEDALRDSVAAATRERVLKIDGALSAGGATADLVNTISRAGPFGAGNPEPVFALPSHTLAYADVVGGSHIRMRLRAGDGALVDAISFRSADQPFGKVLMESRGRRVHAAGCLTIDRWQGGERVQMRLFDMADAS